MARRFWGTVFVLATLIAIPGGLLAYVALKHLLPLLPSGHPLTAKAHFRPQAWERMN